MGPKLKYSPGLRFGRLETIRLEKKGWLMRCDCGTEKIISITGVVRGKVKSCGCLNIEHHKSGLNHLKHGDAKKGNVSKLHNKWRSILGRCHSSNIKITNRYGERGIKVCKEWREDYLVFKEWALKNGYSDKLTIDRIDNNGNYEPKNCRFVDAKEQARNRRTSRFETIDGETKTVAEWAEIFKKPYEEMRSFFSSSRWREKTDSIINDCVECGGKGYYINNGYTIQNNKLFISNRWLNKPVTCNLCKGKPRKEIDG